MQPSDLSRNSDMDNRTAWLPLQCGPLSLFFDPATAALRGIRLDDRNAVQAIGIVVRDRNWGTVLPQIEDLQVEGAPDRFKLAFAARHREREIDIAWSGDVVGQADGTIRFRMEGEARSTFRRNRIGFCILYPIAECAGKPCVTETVNGAREDGFFPDLLSAYQPFRNLRSFRHEVSPDLWVEVGLEGDTFEMEDHRNWTDASFKIYSTPLELPFPVEVPAGTRIVQTVTLTLPGYPGKLNVAAPPIRENPRIGFPGNGTFFTPVTGPVTDEDSPVTLRLADAPPIPLPRIGLGVASHGKPLTLRETERLQTLALSHLRLDLTPSKPEWQAKLFQATEEVWRLRIGLEVALLLTGDGSAELAAVASVVEQLRPPIVRWLVFHCDRKTSPVEIVRTARDILAPLTPNAQVGGGTNAYFAELNRERPATALFDCICYSINPQVHAFDMASLIENVDGQAPTVRTARSFCHDLSLVISPVTLKPRINVYATGGEPAPGFEELPPQVDTRQSTQFAAGWTLVSLKALCESGVHSITYYETTGWRGIMETEEGSPLPQAFHSAPGEVFPMFHVFADIGAFAGGEVLPLTSSAHGKVEGMALRVDDGAAVLCANLTSEPQRLRLLLPSHITRLTPQRMAAENLEEGQRLSPRGLDGIVEEELPHVPVNQGAAEWEMPPFAYARFDWRE